ncbi:MAG: heme-degrading domain-containing protein [Spirochaetes bacterium]|nr:MAG: heme-degrading domain-containing protein [Spirochaetota bacterium]RKX97269.1 MAG: heme-degrading domain-containing protein [Spirochaetota bacterium]
MRSMKMENTELETLLAQEKELVFSRFTDSDAWALGSWMVETARDRKLPIAIDIVRHGHRLFHYSFDGASPDNEQWIKRKAALVDRVGHSSFYVGRELASSGKTIEESKLISEKDFGPHGGAFPLIIKNVGPVGHVAVSGLPQEQDHALVVEALRAHIARGE